MSASFTTYNESLKLVTEPIHEMALKVKELIELSEKALENPKDSSYKQAKDKPIAAGIEKLKSLQKEVNNAKSDISTFIVVEKAIPKFESQLKQAEVTLNFLDKAAKELGVKPESIKEFKDLDETVYIAKRDVKYLKKVVEIAKKTLKEF